MKFSDFKDKLRNYPVFRSNIFELICDDVPTLRRQLTEWTRKAWVISLKRGVYTLREEDRAVQFSKFFLANYLYTPSYISLETALSYYGLIPEGVYAMTSVSTKKSQQFSNFYGKFHYAHIKTSVYHHYQAERDEFSNTFYIATKEKALLDFIYLKCRTLSTFDADVFELSWRLQNLESLDTTKLE